MKMIRSAGGNYAEIDIEGLDNNVTLLFDHENKKIPVW